VSAHVFRCASESAHVQNVFSVVNESAHVFCSASESAHIASESAHVGVYDSADVFCGASDSAHELSCAKECAHVFSGASECGTSVSAQVFSGAYESVHVLRAVQCIDDSACVVGDGSVYFPDSNVDGYENLCKNQCVGTRNGDDNESNGNDNDNDNDNFIVLIYMGNLTCGCQ